MARRQIGTGVAVAFLLLAGCGSGARNSANTADAAGGGDNAAATTTVEDVSPDSLVAPDNMAFDGDEDTDNGALANGD